MQSKVSADAVIDMHDRRTHVQFCEIADNLFRIDNSLTAIASFATGPCAQHIGFTDDHTVGQFHTLLYRANANAVTVTDKMLCKTINVPGFDVMLTQELVENLAARTSGAKGEMPRCILHTP